MADERTKGGQDVTRGVSQETPWDVAELDLDIREAVETHLKRFLGSDVQVWHEIMSAYVHLDLYRFEPTPERPFFTFVTSGMSDQPMHVPEGMEDMSRAELLICLPSEWPVDDPDRSWPVDLLKSLARMPYEYQSWVGLGTSITNGNPPSTMPDTAFTGTIVGPTATLPEEFVRLDVNGSQIWFYGIYPIYPEEMTFKTDTPSGDEALLQRLLKSGVTELLNTKRKNTCRRRLFGLF